MTSHKDDGRAFQLRAKHAVEATLGITLRLEVMIPGGPPGRRFDFASADFSIVGEAKRYSWTVSGNDPSAKLKDLRTTAADLQALPPSTHTFLVMARSVHPHKGGLAEMYARRDRARLGPVTVLEFDESSGTLRVVRQGRLRLP